MTEIFRIALPVAGTYLGLMTMGLVDLIWVGRVGTTATGAVGIGTSFFAWFLIFGIGLLAGMDYLVASSFGAGRLDECRATLRHGLKLGALLAIPLTAVLLFFSYHLAWFHLNPEVVPQAEGYLRVRSICLPPAATICSR
jgi:MATE family multidrug resistance protein